MIAPSAQNQVPRKVFLKIGRPGYRVTKVRDRDTGKEGMMVQVHLPQIKPGVIPRRRFMSAWEQKREPPNKAYQYLIVSSNVASACAFFHQALHRSPPSHMRLLHSAFLRGKSRTSLMMQATGTGRTGIPIPSNTASNSCSVCSTDVVVVCIISLF